MCGDIKDLAEHVAKRSIRLRVRDSFFDNHMPVIPVWPVTDDGDLCLTLEERLDLSDRPSQFVSLRPAVPIGPDELHRRGIWGSMLCFAASAAWLGISSQFACAVFLY